jgi:CRISPR-associated protein Csd1
MLHELLSYTDSHLGESEPGFRTREVRWAIELGSDGRFLNVLPLGDAKRGEDLSRCPEMHGMQSGGKSHFLVESAQTIALLMKGDEDDAKVAAAETRHRFYLRLLHEAALECAALTPLVGVLDDANCRDAIRAALAAHKAKPTDWITWRVDGRDPRLETGVQDWWRAWRHNGSGSAASSPAQPTGGVAANDELMVCLLTGQPAIPLLTQPKITGLSRVGGIAMGDVMVGFDKAAFCSFGFNQSANAAMSAEATQKYVDGLNHLIRNHSREVANALVVHWYQESLTPEDDPLSFLAGMETEDQAEAAALGAARALLNAVRAGQRPDLANNHYYALTLSGAAGRVMVRDWTEGQFEELLRNITAWFEDLQIVSREGKGHARDPKFMAVCGALVRDLKDLPASTVATLWKASLKGLPIPRPLLAQALARFRAELVDKDQPALNHARMGLIKAYFVRRIPGGDTNMTATYNPRHPAAAYHCGGLLALFASLQHAALGDVGAGVVQRFYAATSQTPGLMLGRLAANARNHLAKLEPGLARWYEERIAENMSGLGDAAPRILDLEGQGLFALGYYQKLAQLRSGRKPTADDTTQQEIQT